MFGTIVVVSALVASVYLSTLTVNAADLSDFQREYGSRRVERPERADCAIPYSYWGPY